MSNDHIKLYLLSAMTMGAIFIAIASTAFSSPSTNPPIGAVTPTFSGLNVSGDFDFRGTLRNNGSTYIPGFGTIQAPVKINDLLSVTDGAMIGGNVALTGALSASGNIRSTEGSIGRFYVRSNSINIPTGGLGNEIVTATCDDGDYASGCASSFISDHYLDRNIGEIAGSNFCTAQAKNLGGTDGDMLYVYTTCFSSN
ncbi:hypothetical protein KKD70_00300 [Patescibacteria group bacterium]|nr:hypothetical protein [Patescibacteria group bacterium]